MYILYDSVVSGADSDPSSDMIGNATSKLISALNSTDMTPSVTTETVEASNWGPKRDPLIVVVPITIIYALIFLLGIVGNVSTCIVIARNKHMHTATNYYLFSLAVSDMLLLVSGLPPEMYYHWSRYPYVFGEAFCMIQGFAAETSANATVLTITAFTVERYVAICHPFQSHTVSKLSRAVRFIVGIWVLALCLAVPQAIQFGVVYERRPDGTILDEEHAVCAVKRIVIPHSFEISSFVFFLAPMTLITVLYVLIGLQLHRSSILARRDKGSVRLKNQVHHKKVLHVAASSSPKNRPVGAMATSQTTGDATAHHPPPPPPQPPHEEEEDGRKNFARNAQAKAAKHVVKMLVAVVVTFFICWAPFHAQRLLAVYGGGDAERRPSPVMIIIYSILTYTSGVLYYLSTTVNPVLYHIMSNKFREAFKDTLARYLGRRRGRGGRWKCYSVLSARSSRHSNNSSTCCHSNNSNASQRSSSGGGGGGGGKCLRYLEADMARLHESRRPVVVSFRRPASNSSLLTMDTSTTTASSSEVYVSLEAALRNPRHGQRKSRILLNESYLGVICKHPKPSILKDMIRKDNLPDRKMFRFSTPSPSSSLSHDTSLGVTCEDNFTLLPYPKLNISEAASFESVVTHVDVPLPDSGYENEGSKTNDPSSDPKQINFPKIEDIEIFQEQRLMIQSSLKRRRQLKYKLVKNGKNPSHTTSCSNIDKDTIIVARSNDASLSNHKLLNGRTSPTMTRSCTMPCVTSLERELTPDESSRRMDIINEEFEKKWSVDAGRGEVDLRPNGSRVDILPEELCERISNVVGHVDVHGYAMLMEDVNLSLEEKASCNNLNNKAQNSDFLGNRDTSFNYPGLESTDDSRNENPLHDTPFKRRAGESQVGFHLKDLENCNNDLLFKRHKKRKSEEVGHPSRQTCEVEGFHQKESILFNDRVLVCYEAEPEDPESKVIRQSPASPDLQSYQIKCYFPKAINPRRPRSCFDLRDYLNYPANLDRNGIYNKTINVSSPNYSRVNSLIICHSCEGKLVFKHHVPVFLNSLFEFKKD